MSDCLHQSTQVRSCGRISRSMLRRSSSIFRMLETIGRSKLRTKAITSLTLLKWYTFPAHLAVETLNAHRILHIPRRTQPDTRRPIHRTHWLQRAQSTTPGTTQLPGRRRSSSRSMDGGDRWTFWRSVTLCRSNSVYVQGRSPQRPPDHLFCRVVPGQGQFL